MLSGPPFCVLFWMQVFCSAGLVPLLVTWGLRSPAPDPSLHGSLTCSGCQHCTATATPIPPSPQQAEQVLLFLNWMPSPASAPATAAPPLCLWGQGLAQGWLAGTAQCWNRSLHPHHLPPRLAAQNIREGARACGTMKAGVSGNGFGPPVPARLVGWLGAGALEAALGCELQQEGSRFISEQKLQLLTPSRAPGQSYQCWV